MFPVNRRFATTLVTLPADQTEWNAVDAPTGDMEVLGPDDTWGLGNAAAEVLAQVVADHPMTTSS